MARRGSTDQQNQCREELGIENSRRWRSNWERVYLSFQTRCNAIPAAKPMSSCPTKLVAMMYNQTGSAKYKMATSAIENTFISACI